MGDGRQKTDFAEERDGFRFRGGCNAIDLPATLQARLKPAPRELLGTPGDLARWLRAAGLAACLPETTEADLATAHALREAIYALANGLRTGNDDTAARVVLNRIASGAPAVPQLLPNGGGVHLDGSADALLVTLAREAITLLGGEDAGHIRQCESPTCTLLFIDTSRKGTRRWCSMSACGTRAKVAEFRRRKRTSLPDM
jgi:predicted RNA-binding Zn ribbon-like protein